MNNSVSKPLVIIGAGGHASVLVDILRSQDREVIAVISPDEIEARSVFSGITHLFRDEDILQFATDKILLVNGIGPLPKSDLKRKINEKFAELGYKFETVISDKAVVSAYSHISPGVQVMAGAIIQTGAVIGAHTVINSGAIVEHDCQIGEYNHIAPSATLCGQVSTEADVFVGVASVVIQNISLECGATVGAGAVVTKTLNAGQTIYSARSSVN